MSPPTRSLLSGRPPKRKRTDAELHELARVLGADWTPGDTVQTWLHKHEGKTGELSHMVETGWLWEDIGKAMHLAGITYRTGQQIPAHTLRLKAYLSRTRERERMAAEAARDTQPPVTLALEAPGQKPNFAASEEAGAIAPEEPAFRLVTLKGGQQPPKPQPPATHPPPERPAATKESDEGLLRRVFGKP